MTQWSEGFQFDCDTAVQINAFIIFLACDLSSFLNSNIYFSAQYLFYRPHYWFNFNSSVVQL